LKLSHVYVVLDGADKEFKCTYKTVRRASRLIEKYMTIGWYAFIRSLNFYPGDRLHFVAQNPVD
jgi:hypothetical protein